MLNYSNLSDVEFENLCCDFMSSQLGVNLHKFAPGRDGGIDLRDDNGEIIVQVKHFINSTAEQLIASLKKEVPKVKELNPKKYFVCCSKQLSPQKIDEIHNLFTDYMSSNANIFTLTEIDDFLINPKNVEILKKHYKLWIGSTNIIEDIFVKDIGIDSEILFSDIKSEMNFFVRTKAFDVALDCLEKTRALLIIGDPGVGKTTTSKMLILHYISQGYKLKYTTDGTNLSDLKKALTLNPESKEVVFLDDCFGQAYFQMKETQGNELLQIIKHVNIHPNKFLILNSRITIYSEAKNKTPELVKSLENKNYKLFMLDMSHISSLDKAEILYNHLFFNRIEARYFKRITEDRRYLQIINHPNYNPRIIEFISKKDVYKKVSPEKYFDFIIKSLNNPRQVWEDEYENRLGKADRILLNTIYSLTNTLVPISLVKECYDYRMRSEEGIDFSVNQFERSLKRLEKAFVKIVDSYGNKMLSMSNPSINDFFDAYLEENTLEKNNILKSIHSIRQCKRMLSDNQCQIQIEQIVKSHEILDYCFENEIQRTGYITFCIAEYGIQDKKYLPIIESYLYNICDVNIYEKSGVLKINILKKLLNDKFIEFYKLDEFFRNALFLNDFLDKLQLDDLVYTITIIEKFFLDVERENFIEIAKRMICKEINNFCYDVPAENYQIDISNIVDTYEESGDIDRYGIEEEIEQEISDCVKDEITYYLDMLPQDIEIDKNILDNIIVSVNGISHLIDDYFADIDYDPELLYEKDFDTENEIDLIFNRTFSE